MGKGRLSVGVVLGGEPASLLEKDSKNWRWRVLEFADEKPLPVLGQWSL
jgi:hypothetical protein